MSSLPGPTEVNSRLPKMADLLRFSGPITGQRECRPMASWRGRDTVVEPSLGLIQ
jgi:hypothetical protein